MYCFYMYDETTHTALCACALCVCFVARAHLSLFPHAHAHTLHVSSDEVGTAVAECYGVSSGTPSGGT